MKNNNKKIKLKKKQNKKIKIYSVCTYKHKCETNSNTLLFNEHTHILITGFIYNTVKHNTVFLVVF